MPVRTDTSRVAAACRNCRERKVKCSGGSPCRDCIRQKKECFYPPLLRRRRVKDKQVNENQVVTVTEVIENRLSRMEALLQVATMGELEESVSSSPQLRQNAPRGVPTPLYTPSGIENEHSRQRLGSITTSERSPALTRSTESQLSSKSSAPPGSLQSPPRGPLNQGQQNVVPYPSHSPVQSTKRDSYDETLVEKVLGGGGSAIPFQKIIWEHHDPWPLVSVCSPAGLKWVCERMGTNEFTDSVNSPTNGWSQRLTMRRDQMTSFNCPEVDETTAWKYVNAYFDHSYDTVLGVLDRAPFESRLRAHFHTSPTRREEASWYALRNVVYAEGCRCILAKDSSVSFVHAQTQAWRYFKNALSIFTELLFGPSSFSAVQALTLMTLYVQGLGSPALEYVLCANAVRMAQARGLHRQPTNSQGLLETDMLSRNWLWWVVYCLEKQIAFRSGRPSAIVDDDISTQIPTTAAPGSTLDVELFTFIVKHAQISSQISRRVMSVKGFQQSPAELLNTVTDLHKQLKQLLDCLPMDLKISAPTRWYQNFHSTSRLAGIIYLHFAIYGSLMAIHTPFFYPWIYAPFCTEDTPTIRSQIKVSSDIVADAARKIILVIRGITIDVTSPSWLALYYPMYAHKNLFVYILKYPTLSTARSDVVLLEVCAGHFGHTEFVTSSEVSITLPRDSATIASKAVKVAKENERERGSGVLATQTGNNSREITQTISGEAGLAGVTGTNGESTVHLPYGMNETPEFYGMDFDMEPWNIFPSVDIVDNGGITFETVQL